MVRKVLKYICLAVCLGPLSAIFLMGCSQAENPGEKVPSITPMESSDSLLTIAREIVAAAGNCALITVDSTGTAAVRTMDPFPPNENFEIWFGTNRHSRKVTQIKQNSGVSIYYADPQSGAYLTVVGEASIIDDPDHKARYWKEAWDAFYPNRETYTLIRVVPQQLEVISEKHGIVGDPKTWRAAVLKM